MRVWDQNAELGTRNPERTEANPEDSDVTFSGVRSAAFDELTPRIGLQVHQLVNVGDVLKGTGNVYSDEAFCFEWPDHYR
jgi:hypothetical protein